MSTLISSLGRRFKEKKCTGKNLNLPALPTPREVLEDIEGCQGNDPVIQLAMLIQKKGRQASSLLDKEFLTEDPSSATGASSAAHLAFLLPYQQSGASSDKVGGGVSSPVEEVAHSHGGRDAGGGGRRKGSIASTGGGHSAEHLESYNKLKQFILLCEKSEEILENLEGNFKRVEGMLKEGDGCGGDVNFNARLNDKGNILQIEIKDEKNNVKDDNEEEEGEWAAAGDYDDGEEEGQDEDSYKEADSDDVCSSPLL